MGRLCSQLHCGAHRDVLHSPCEWFYHRCHCNCRDSVLFVGRRPFLRAPMCCGSVCVAMSYGGGFFSPGGAYDSVWDSVKPIAGKYLINYFQHHEDVGCVCMLNGWFSNNDDICADNFIFSRFKLKDKCRSEKWEVYLCGDMSIMVVRVQVPRFCFDRAWGPDVQKTAEVSASAVLGVTG